jgi:hypothetical protein
LSSKSVEHFLCNNLCRNAQVKQGILKKEERLSVDDFVQVLMEIKAKTLNFQTALQDPNAFMKRIQLFEKAAQKDAFVVCSSALKLQFTHFLDEELFLAYVQDWKIHHKSLQTLHTSLIYTKANKQAQGLRITYLS